MKSKYTLAVTICQDWLHRYGLRNFPTRRYELKKRAETMAETRQRIAEAAVELHGTGGPARTTMSAVAKRAGVQRHTVYRHFPTAAELFGACSSHFFTQNPPPEHRAWRAIRDPRERLAHALDDLYAYYERTEMMFSNVLRDVELVDALQPTLVPMQAFMAEATEILAVGWGTRGRRRQVLAAAIAHGLDFQTWRSVPTDERVARADAVELVAALIDAAAKPRRRSKA